MQPEIGKWVSREFDNGPGPEDDERETDYHFVESVIEGAAITTCGRRMAPHLLGRANHLNVVDTMPLTRMIGQPQLCQAGCGNKAIQLGVLNIAGILSAVRAAEEVALEEVANFIAKDAKARAPIRKVFREAAGFKRKFRALTSPERTLAIKRAMAYKGYDDFQRRRSVSYLQNYARAELPRRGSANSLSRSRKLRQLGIERKGRFTAATDAIRSGRGFQSASLHPLLTSRGRYEVRSGRAIHRETTEGGAARVQIGGGLKASIGNEGVVQADNGAAARITAAIRYAKYVEFPTTHNASQPFLLPALHDSRSRLRSALARELRKALGG